MAMTVILQIVTNYFILSYIRFITEILSHSHDAQSPDLGLFKLEGAAR
ncbi:hypothetical protein [Orenia metallireducens]|nr:hypothetical protein [Orenia metallireducens]